MKRVLALLAIMLALGGVAHATGLTGYACQGWGLTVLAGPSVCGTAPAPGSNFILLVDNSSKILQTDNTSKICLAGGC